MRKLLGDLLVPVVARADLMIGPNFDKVFVLQRSQMANKTVLEFLVDVAVGNKEPKSFSLLVSGQGEQTSSTSLDDDLLFLSK